MHEGYFVGRKELIGWIQQHFQPSFQKIEDLGSGVVYCQIIDSIYPECKVMAKVKRDAKIEVDYINNFKQLQKAFSQKKIDRFIEIDKLSKKSFQTNMEFVQARPPSTASDASDPRLHAGPAAPPWAPRTARWPRGAAVGTPDCTRAPRRRRGVPPACMPLTSLTTALAFASVCLSVYEVLLGHACTQRRRRGARGYSGAARRPGGQRARRHYGASRP
jgi:hypothetical protein